MHKPSSTTLYCFSPPVMLATFAIEILLALYTLLHMRRSRASAVIIATLACLAIFQLAEYQTCGADNSKEAWSRLGFVAITLLPPLGVHLATILTKTKGRLLTIISYAASAIFIAIFALAPAPIYSSVCGGNYVIFHLNGSLGWWYGAYYYLLIFTCLMIAAGATFGKAPRSKTARRWFIFGVLVFLLPTATVNVYYPQTVAGIPSIMCGFALMYALVLGLKIAPMTSRQK